MRRSCTFQCVPHILRLVSYLYCVLFSPPQFGCDTTSQPSIYIFLFLFAIHRDSSGARFSRKSSIALALKISNAVYSELIVIGVSIAD